MPVPPAVPALPDAERRTSYTITAQTGPFAVGFQLYGDSTDYGDWITVWLNEALLVAGTDYTMSSFTGSIGSIPLPINDATITLTVARTGTLQIIGARRPRRLTQFAENRGVPARDHNEAITDITAQMRETWDLIRSRVVLAPGGDFLSPLPPVANRANTAFLFDGSGNPACTPVTITGGVGTVTLSLTRAQIPTVHVSPNTIVVSGYAAAGDRGAGSIYTSNGAGPSGIGAIQDLGGVWFNLVITTVVNVGWFGAKGDNVTDDTAAVTAAYNAIVAIGGGVLYFPSGSYLISTFPTITQQGTRIVGESRADSHVSSGRGTILRQTAAAGDFLVFSNTAECSVEWISFYPTQRLASGYTIQVSNVFRMTVSHVRMDYIYNGILMWNSANSMIVEAVDMRQILGTRGINMTYQGTNGAQGLYVRNFVTDNGFVNNGAFKGNWAQSTSYIVGDIVLANGTIWNCTTPGTSLNTGTGPSGYPAGTDPALVFTNTVADNTVRWNWCFLNDLTWIIMDSYCGTLTIAGGTGLLDGGIGIKMVDSANTTNSFPLFLVCYDLECDHNLYCGAFLDGGDSAMFVNCFFGSTQTQSNFQLRPNHKGDVQVCNSTLGSCWTNGLEINPGPVNNVFCNNIISRNSQFLIFNAGGDSGILLLAGASHNVITGNKCGAFAPGGPFGGVDGQAYGITVQGGAGDYNFIADNDVSSNFAGGINCGAVTGTHNLVVNNIGYNPVGVTSPTPGASPWTFTNGPSAATLFVSAVTSITGITVGGASILPASIGANTSFGISLAPNQVAVITYSGALTAKLSTY